MNLEQAKQRVRDWSRGVRNRLSDDAISVHVATTGESRGIAREIAPKLGWIAIISLAVTIGRVAWMLWLLWRENPDATEEEEAQILAMIDADSLGLND